MAKARSTRRGKLSRAGRDVVAGFKALADEREGKITLKRTTVDVESVALSAEQIVAVRETFNMSRAVFARYFRIPVRTLERWEQGRSSPTGPGAVLILLASKYPDTLKRLKTLGSLLSGREMRGGTAPR